MKELGHNIFIEGFDFEHAFRSRMYGAKGISNKVLLIYQGKVCEVPDMIATKEAIKEACKNEYCIIYKKIETIEMLEHENLPF